MGNVRTCTVSFTGYSGTQHSVDVTADSLYEAALLGVRAICEQWEKPLRYPQASSLRSDHHPLRTRSA